MRNHTTAKLHELVSSSGGKNPTVTPGASQQSATFLMNALPTGKLGKFWYYAQAAIVKLTTVIDQDTVTGSAAIAADKLWKVMASFSVQSPILGQLYTHSNTRGCTVGNIIAPMGMGFSQLPIRTAVAANDGNTTVDLYYRIPFGYEFLRKPHETAPWTGFLEGGQIECKLDVTSIFDSDSTGAEVIATTSMRAALELIPSPEACIHVPCHWREHILTGGSTKHTILDLGAPDGLNGTDQSKGVGVAALLYLTDATGIGLGGADGADNIISYDCNWRDQDRIDFVDAAYVNMFASVGPQRRFTTTTTGSYGGWPYTIAATGVNALNDAQALFFPFVFPSRDLETSKLQTVYGAKDINVGYTSTPSGAPRFLGMYMHTFDEQFIQGLASRIAPGFSGQLVAKTLNKQSGMVPGVGKGAYVRRKLKA